MSKVVRDGISQNDYTALNEECKSPGIPIRVVGVRMEDKTTAIVRLEVGDFKSSRTMTYESGGWYMEPTSEFRKVLGKPLKKILAQLKASGSC